MLSYEEVMNILQELRDQDEDVMETRVKTAPDITLDVLFMQKKHPEAVRYLLSEEGAGDDEGK